ncbi:beta-ketoacyl synthase N-terminal-like domain-containing protein, partial [Bacillus amyloliquefaciens]|uniref:beta-ketoacyl synthase N-terminal-like domain-containing protein n=1 Tax=Bacillus amyloliquefaciens TaxID=1390 RepID=UPI0023F8F6DC
MAVAPCDFDDSERSSSRLPLDRGTAMAMAAARAAFSASGLEAAALDGDRLGVYWGSGMAGSASFDAAARGL